MWNYACCKKNTNIIIKGFVCLCLDPSSVSEEKIYVLKIYIFGTLNISYVFTCTQIARYCWRKTHKHSDRSHYHNHKSDMGPQSAWPSYWLLCTPMVVFPLSKMTILLLFLPSKTQHTHPTTHLPLSLVSISPALTWHWENRSNLIRNSLLLATMTVVTSYLSSSAPANNCLHMQSRIESLSLLQVNWVFPASWVSPSLLDHPCHCTKCPGNLPSYKDLR